MDYLNLNKDNYTEQNGGINVKKPKIILNGIKILILVLWIVISIINPRYFFLYSAIAYIIVGNIIFIETNRKEAGKLILLIAGAIYHVMMHITVLIYFDSKEAMPANTIILLVVGEVFFSVGCYTVLYRLIDDYYRNKRIYQTVEAEIVDVQKTTKSIGNDSGGVTIDVYYPTIIYELNGRLFKEKSNRYRREMPSIGEKYKIKVNPDNPAEFNDNINLISKGRVLLSIRSMVILLLFCTIWFAPWYAIPKLNAFLRLFSKN